MSPVWRARLRSLLPGLLVTAALLVTATVGMELLSHEPPARDSARLMTAAPGHAGSSPDGGCLRTVEFGAAGCGVGVAAGTGRAPGAETAGRFQQGGSGAIRASDAGKTFARSEAARRQATCGEQSDG